MGLGIPPLKITTPLESKPVKSGIFVRRGDQPTEGRLAASLGRKGTHGVSTNGVTANFMLFDGGTFWVLPLTICIKLIILFTTLCKLWTNCLNHMFVWIAGLYLPYCRLRYRYRFVFSLVVTSRDSPLIPRLLRPWGRDCPIIISSTINIIIIIIIIIN